MIPFDYEQLYIYDQNIRISKGISTFCGVDEAGRGPLAGPVFAAAVVLSPDSRFSSLRDSKKISEKKREALIEQILEEALDFHIAAASEKEIDSYNILRATHLAMTRAVAGLQTSPQFALVDGNSLPSSLKIPGDTLIKGDDTSASVAAAAILAKVARDRYMRLLDEKYPAYGFAKHKGYGTAAHYKAIQQAGISPVHRLTFLKKEIAAGIPILEEA